MTSKIEWLKGGESWNFVAGCQKVSEGCACCYAEKRALLLRSNPDISEGTRLAYQTVTDPTKQSWNGRVSIIPGKMELPKRWREGRLIFPQSMSDLFFDPVPDYIIEKAFEVMLDCPQHTFVVLTKRAHRMREMLTDASWWAGTHSQFRRHIWLGVSVENDKVRYRIEDLVRIPARVHLVSAEPLLCPLDIREWLRGPDIFDGAGDQNGIQGVFTGGQTGPRARPMAPAWAIQIRDDCLAEGATFFHKSNGVWIQVGQQEEQEEEGRYQDRINIFNRSGEFQYTAIMNRVGKQRAGRQLNGRTWDDLPDGR